MEKFLKILSISSISLIVGLGAGTFYSTSAQNQKVFELRTYQATPGNLGNLHARFRDHTIRIFRKHGMEIVGFWSPTSEEERDDILVYLLAHDSQDAADASWQAFGADPEWASVAEESNKNGQILAGVERKYMVATDYSPMK
ncbi:MAG: NIPSNAP family protein [Pseudohongiellaceae bacterium]